ncbi:MAG: hypothetical protein ACMZ7B_11730 [Balneola sp.]
MPSDLKSIFAYTSSPQDVFYNVIESCENSMYCHIELLKLFMNALKTNSIYYRIGTFTASPTIPDLPTLALLLDYLPEDIKDPYWQVYYEQWNFEQDVPSIGNFASYVRTYTGAGVPADLKAAVDCVRSVYYANAYNDLVEEYKKISWPGVPTPPAVIPNVNPQNPALTPANVTTEIQKLVSWILANDPELVALKGLYDLADAAKILSAVFGSPPVANVNISLFCEELISVIQQNGDDPIGTKLAKTIFFETVKNAIDVDPFWKTTEITKKLAESFSDPYTPANRYWSKSTKRITQAFSIISQMMETALTSDDATVKTNASKSIGQIFTDFGVSTNSVPSFLVNQLQAVCVNLYEIINADPSTLKAFITELTEPIPATIFYSDINTLLKIVDEVILSIKLKYNHQDVLLFPFSNYDNIKSKPGVTFNPFGSKPEETNKIEVVADADETKPYPTSYSRPIVGVFTNAAKGAATFLKFFNFNGANNGSYYFTDPVNPGLVQANGFSAPPAPLYFNFTEVTVNGSKTTPTGEDYAEPTGTGISKKNFYTAIRALSKWGALQGQRNYDVIYETIYDASGPSITINPHLIWYIGSGDLNRTDIIDDSLCVLAWLAPKALIDKYQKLPQILKLPARYVTDISFSMLSLKGGDITWVMNYLSVGDDSGEYDYVLVNTPSPNLPAEIDAALERDSGTSSSLSAEAQIIMQLFNFQYYRKMKDKKVIKYLPAKNKPDSTAGGKDLGAIGPDGEQAIGIDPPISFRLDKNLQFFKNYTKPDGPAGAYLKNKGNPLYREKGKRIAAGSVMSKLVGDIGVDPKPIVTSSSLSATNFGNWVLSQSEKSLQEYKELKDTTRGYLPTDQEWCHLLGHGDGGDERLGNFVSGSFHCNTEQLAMESKGRRQVTQRAPKGTYELRSTAYLFNDEQALLSKNYLRNDSAYQKMAQVYDALKKKQGKAMRTNGAGKVTPFAALMRYKMYRNESSGASSDGEPPNTKSIKLFDHIFEGQSEFIDQHQFSILKHAAWFAMAGMDAFDKWYTEQAKALASGDAAE